MSKDEWYKCEFYIKGDSAEIVDYIMKQPNKITNVSITKVIDLPTEDQDTNTRTL